MTTTLELDNTNTGGMVISFADDNVSFSYPYSLVTGHFLSNTNMKTSTVLCPTGLFKLQVFPKSQHFISMPSIHSMQFFSSNCIYLYIMRV